MIRYLFILCSFLFIQDEPVISWSDSYKLSWSDFKNKSNGHPTAAAVTASGITFGFSIKQTDTKVVSYTTEVHSHFYPEKSWYNIKLADIHVLGHEQLHFDITELYARKLKQRISKLKVSNSIRKELKKLHNDINRELAAFQDKYDDETNYSRNIEVQEKWKTYITSELQKLSKYKSIN